MLLKQLLSLSSHHIAGLVLSLLAFGTSLTCFPTSSDQLAQTKSKGEPDATIANIEDELTGMIKSIKAEADETF